ncbi:unnamed protein product [Adineta ricciae]|uniref:Phage tail collar domain-containing protein n=1 Tax=Adineta ricciae TaxID=249248 RepID=A0A815V480_ADIRI|nr:unnamed protein product [Adineta ricciae]CAF1599430.1 unnamed protein product [Adineta ricciae]
MELEERTDSDYISQGDQTILIELLKLSLLRNSVVLDGQVKQQWNSVYSNHDSIRPDRIVYLLNDELRELQNRTNLADKNQNSTQQIYDTKVSGHNAVHESFDHSDNRVNSVHDKTDRTDDKYLSYSKGQQRVSQNNSDRSAGNSTGHSESSSKHTERTRGESISANVGIGSFSAGFSHGQTKTDIDGSSNAHANHNSHGWHNASSTFQDDSYQNSNASKTLRVTGDDMSIYNADAWRRAVSVDNRNLDNNAQTFDELRQKNFDFYMKNRQFVQFNGEKFIVKPVEAYRLNLADYTENKKFVDKKVTVARIESIHTLPIRILPSLSSHTGRTHVPAVDSYSNIFESKLDELSKEFGIFESNMEKTQLNMDKQFKELRTSYSVLGTVPHIDNHTKLLESSVHTLDSTLTGVKADGQNIKDRVNKLYEKIASLDTATKNNSNSLQAPTTSLFTEVKTLMRTIESNVEKLRLNTDRQLTELQSSDSIVKKDIEKLTVHTSYASPSVGEIRLYSGTELSVPHNWTFCQGQELSRTTYHKLFYVIGTSFGNGNGHSTFNVPDLRGRVAIGRDPSAIRANYALETGAAGGHAVHTLTTVELPTHHHESGSLKTEMSGSHTHGIKEPGHAHSLRYDDRGYFSGKKDWVKNIHYPHSSATQLATSTTYTGVEVYASGSHTHTLTGNTASTGNGSSFSLLNPYQILEYIIYTGDYVGHDTKDYFERVSDFGSDTQSQTIADDDLEVLADSNTESEQADTLVSVTSTKPNNIRICDNCYDGSTNCCDTCEDVINIYKKNNWAYNKSKFLQCNTK